MSDEKRSVAMLSAQLQREMEKREKEVSTAYICAIFAGMCGAHKFYMRKIVSGALFCAPTVATVFLYVRYFLTGTNKDLTFTIILVFAAFGTVSLANVARLIYDFFTMKKQVAEVNTRIEEMLVNQISPE